MEPSELMQYVAQTLEQLGIEYRVVGWMASIAMTIGGKRGAVQNPLLRYAEEGPA